MDRQLPAAREFKIAKVTDNLKKTIFSRTGFSNYVKVIKTCQYLYVLGTGELVPDRFELGKCILVVAPSENGATCVQIVNSQAVSYTDPKSYRLQDIQASFKNVHFGSLEVPVMAGADIFYMGDALSVDDNSLTEILTSLDDVGSTVDRMIIPYVEWQTLVSSASWLEKLEMNALVLTAMESPYELTSLYEFVVSSNQINWLQLELSSRQQQWLPEVVRLHEFWQKNGPVDNKMIVLRMIVTELPLILEEHIQLTAEKIDNFGCLCKRLIMARFAGDNMPMFLTLLCIKSEIFAFCLHADNPDSIFSVIRKILTDRRYMDCLFTPRYFCPHIAESERLYPKMFPSEELETFLKTFF